jgi:hypothetical protein
MAKSLRIKNVGTEQFCDLADGEEYILDPGDVVQVPAGVAHLFAGNPALLNGEQPADAIAERERIRRRQPGNKPPTLEILEPAKKKVKAPPAPPEIVEPVEEQEEANAFPTLEEVTEERTEVPVREDGDESVAAGSDGELPEGAVPFEEEE